MKHSSYPKKDYSQHGLARTEDFELNLTTRKGKHARKSTDKKEKRKERKQREMGTGQEGEEVISAAESVIPHEDREREREKAEN